ncbi:MAG: DUF2249 domain-containing protein [Pseudomonadota bacterium]
MTGAVLLDVCGLEPPEPMVQVLEALDKLSHGQSLCMLIDREPRPLYHILTENGFVFHTTLRHDQKYEVRIWYPATHHGAPANG